VGSNDRFKSVKRIEKEREKERKESWKRDERLKGRENKCVKLID